MTVDNDNQAYLLELFSLKELGDMTTHIASIIENELGCHTTGFTMWDEDLEEYVDSISHGRCLEAMDSLLEELQSDLDHKVASIKKVDGEDLDESLGHCYLIALEYSAGIVIAFDEEKTHKDLEALIEKYPVKLALKNSWEYTELLRENRRLRNSYDELEGKTTVLEDETRKLINDLTMRDSLRTKQVERERLVYWISHSVRSSVRIQEVLETAVEKIGTTLSLSRCHLLRAGLSDTIDVFQYNDGKVPTIREDLLGKDGLIFMNTALRQKAPHHLDDPTVEEDPLFNNRFLERLGMRTGLIQPIIMREEVLGVLFLEDCTDSREWSIDDMSLVDSLADHLAVAIENADLHKELEKQAVTDGLTGVANRRSFNEALLREFERAKRYSQDLSLIVVDLDFLKKINDTYGHMTGDEAIKKIGHVLAQFSRSTDITARYGGEEFCVLLPNTDIDMAEQLAERLRRLIAETDVEGPGHISASIGVASYPLHAGSSDMLFLRADEALYCAKKDGRNCVKVAIPGKDGVNTKELPGDSKQSLVQESS